MLSFSIVGGWEKRMGIFISKVEKGSKAQEVGLRKGDQLLEVNCHNFEHMTKNKALEILKGTTHLSITVKYNTLGKEFSFVWILTIIFCNFKIY